MFCRPSTGERKLKKGTIWIWQKGRWKQEVLCTKHFQVKSNKKKKKTLPQHSLPARNTLEIKKKKILIWLKRAEEPLLRDWQWRSSDTEALPWMWVRLDATRFPVLPKWLENIQNYIVWLQIWALPAHKVCSSSSNLFGIQTLTVYAACQTSLCPLFPHLDAIFLYGRSVHPHTILCGRLSGIQKT